MEITRVKFVLQMPTFLAVLLTVFLFEVSARQQNCINNTVGLIAVVFNDLTWSVSSWLLVRQRVDFWCTSVFASSSLRTSCRWSVRSRQSLHVATYARQVRVTWLCRGQEQLASVHEASQSLVRQRGTVCRRKSRRHHWHSDSSLAGRKLKCSFAATTRQRSRHNFYYKTARNINSVTELN